MPLRASRYDILRLCGPTGTPSFELEAAQIPLLILRVLCLSFQRVCSSLPSVELDWLHAQRGSVPLSTAGLPPVRTSHTSSICARCMVLFAHRYRQHHAASPAASGILDTPGEAHGVASRYSISFTRAHYRRAARRTSPRPAMHETPVCSVRSARGLFASLIRSTAAGFCFHVTTRTPWYVLRTRRARMPCSPGIGSMWPVHSLEDAPWSSDSS
ncbi:hypothetical protein C8Q77DRAFT_279904 [Trametes polyzona]|nr:hypothetical protein C8Q77DRAFT_279904 [Trametes polyzona]